MRALLTLFVVSSLTVIASAQPPDSLWTRTFGGGDDECGYSMQQTTDGGFVIAGSTWSFGAGLTDVYLIKTDANGNQTWQRTFGGGSYDEGRSVQQTSDGGYIIAGTTSSYGTGGSDIYLIKTNSGGDTIWTRTFGGGDDDRGYSVQQTADGGYIITGSTNSYSISDRVNLIKTDAFGNLNWQSTFGGIYGSEGLSVQQTSDGGYIVAGYTYSFGAIGRDIYLIKTDAIGNLTWQHIYGGSGSQSGSSVRQTSDGGFVIAGGGTPSGSSSQVYLIKTDALGDTVWMHTFGGSSADNGRSVQQTADGGYIIAGYTGYNNYYNVLLLKVDASGNQSWQGVYGGSDDDQGYCVRQTSDGGYIISGKTESFGAGNEDVYLIKTDVGGAPITVTLAPLAPPIIIHSLGGSFNYNVSVVNHSISTQNADFWIMTQLPGYVWYGPLLGPINLTLPTNTSISRLRTQTIPAAAPAGVYWYEGRVGDYHGTTTDTSGFSFTKLGVGGWGQGASEWTNTGEKFKVVGARHVVPASGSGTTPTTVITPNPFNPSTVISCELRASSVYGCMILRGG